MSLSWWLYLVAVILLVLAAFGIRAGRASLTLLAAAVLVVAHFVVPPLT